MHNRANWKIGQPDLTVAALRRSLIDFWEATDHESETHVP
jgi:hypothetical protein